LKRSTSAKTFPLSEMAGMPERPRATGRQAPSFTTLQGQYLAFIDLHTKLHRRPPADLQAYFQVTPPSVHNMIMTLERRTLISKQPGVPRSIRVLVDADVLPPLD
jgi:DNA-binding MarR family transcriptional regulator